MCKFFLCKKIKMRRTVKISVLLFLRLKFLLNFQAKSWPEHITNVLCLPKPLILRRILLTLALKTGDMCHGIIDSLVIPRPKLKT